MQNPTRGIARENQHILQYVLLACTAILITFMIPKKGKFKYEFEQGKPWMHEDLSAPFAFAIRKSPEELTMEQNEVKTNFKPIYIYDETIENKQRSKFISLFTKEANAQGGLSEEEKKYMINRGLAILDDYYNSGIIDLDSSHRSRNREFIITEVKNNTGEDKPLLEYYTLGEHTLNDAKSNLLDRVEKDTALNKAFFIKALMNSLTENVFYDKRLSEQKLNEQLDNISSTRGAVKENEKIIKRGSIVTPDKYLILNSLRAEYEGKLGKSYLIYIGYFVLICCLFVVYAFNLSIFHEKTLAHNRSMILILINVLLFTALTAYVVNKNITSVYLIPYCIVPIVLLAFFGVRIAVITHLLVILLCGLIVPNAFEFILVQTLAGFTAVLSMARIRYISQFFISALLIFMTYCLVELGFSFIKSNLIKEISWGTFVWLGGNFILTLLAYPLIYANEKIFGFLSDISLLELSDINNKLLKELFLRAPGTFQHSLQVANLAEAVIDRIGGNALLARVGALYHDIGKLYQPEFFIENQKFGDNPHDGLSEIESAEIIIGHVTKGIEIATEKHLPRNVIDFIRTHHGTTRVEYFYKHYLKDHAEEEVDETVFRYPGPKPSSKEMAVVMMVDSVEAASRSLKEPDEKQIDSLVDKIIDTKIQDAQFDYATITIQEINTARRIIKKLIKSIYHIRIQYPTEVIEKKM
jgi:hypothetical protein